MANLIVIERNRHAQQKIEQNSRKISNITFCFWMGLTRFIKIINYGEKEKGILYTDNFYASLTFAKEILNLAWLPLLK